MQESENPEVVEEAAAAGFRINWVLVLAIVAVLQFILMVVGGVLFHQRNKALEKELISVKKELKDKSAVHDSLQEQIELLSKQLASLKEYSVASSNAALLEKDKQEAPAAGSDSKPAGPPAAEKGKAAVLAAPVPQAPPPPVIPPKLVRPKPEGQSCDLVGKSKDEQTAILKRCVGAMDMTRSGSK